MFQGCLNYENEVMWVVDKINLNLNYISKTFFFWNKKIICEKYNKFPV